MVPGPPTFRSPHCLLSTAATLADAGHAIQPCCLIVDPFNLLPPGKLKPQLDPAPLRCLILDPRPAQSTTTARRLASRDRVPWGSQPCSRGRILELPDGSRRGAGARIRSGFADRLDGSGWLAASVPSSLALPRTHLSAAGSSRSVDFAGLSRASGRRTNSLCCWTSKLEQRVGQQPAARAGRRYGQNSSRGPSPIGDCPIYGWWGGRLELRVDQDLPGCAEGHLAVLQPLFGQSTALDQASSGVVTVVWNIICLLDCLLIGVINQQRKLRTREVFGFQISIRWHAHDVDDADRIRKTRTSRVNR